MYMGEMEVLRSRGRKAWLVTWEHAVDHAQPESKIVAVSKPQFSGRRVRELSSFFMHPWSVGRSSSWRLRLA